MQNADIWEEILLLLDEETLQNVAFKVIEFILFAETLFQILGDICRRHNRRYLLCTVSSFRGSDDLFLNKLLLFASLEFLFFYPEKIYSLRFSGF